jgi:hypothetical protein
MSLLKLLLYFGMAFCLAVSDSTTSRGPRTLHGPFQDPHGRSREQEFLTTTVPHPRRVLDHRQDRAVRVYSYLEISEEPGA